MEYLLNDVDIAIVRVLLREHIANCMDCPVCHFPVDDAIICRNLPCGANECITAYHRRLLHNIEDKFISSRLYDESDYVQHFSND